MQRAIVKPVLSQQPAAARLLFSEVEVELPVAGVFQADEGGLLTGEGERHDVLPCGAPHPRQGPGLPVGDREGQPAPAVESRRTARLFPGQVHGAIEADSIVGQEGGAEPRDAASRW